MTLVLTGMTLTKKKYNSFDTHITKLDLQKFNKT